MQGAGHLKIKGCDFICSVDFGAYACEKGFNRNGGSDELTILVRRDRERYVVIRKVSVKVRSFFRRTRSSSTEQILDPEQFSVFIARLRCADPGCFEILDHAWSQTGRPSLKTLTDHLI
ncbi:MAG: hypothetical protein SPL30_00575 [Succinivibrio sp.]|jgi:hypothetical protein|nr:hypothetical protein [Succinivibrio sp.]